MKKQERQRLFFDVVAFEFFLSSSFISFFFCLTFDDHDDDNDDGRCSRENARARLLTYEELFYKIEECRQQKNCIRAKALDGGGVFFKC